MTLFEAYEDVQARESFMRREALQNTQITFDEIVQVQKLDLPLESCPAQNKHFFCGVAKKLGCQFCAKK